MNEHLQYAGTGGNDQALGQSGTRYDGVLSFEFAKTPFLQDKTDFLKRFEKSSKI